MRRRQCRAGGGLGGWGAIAERFQTSFPDETSCAAFLFDRRWPQGLSAPPVAAGSVVEETGRAYDALTAVAKRRSRPGRRCTGQVAADSMVLGRASRSNPLQWHVGGQLEAQLGITYKTAWLLAQKLRRLSRSSASRWRAWWRSTRPKFLSGRPTTFRSREIREDPYRWRCRGDRPRHK